MRLRDVLVRQPSACPRSWGLDLTSSGSKCPVIFMTANDDEGTRDEAVDAGCIAYLRKPFARHALLNAVSNKEHTESTDAPERQSFELLRQALACRAILASSTRKEQDHDCGC